MEQSRRLALTIAGFLFLLRWTATTGITCKVHLFQTLQIVSLVCQYNTRLRDRKEDYNIEFCDQNSKCSDAVSCNWDESGQNLECMPGPTFEGMSCAVIDFLGGDLICLLPNVHSHHSGSYTCQLVPPDERVQQSCAVVVPWGKNKDEEKSKDEKSKDEKSKDERKSSSVHEWLQTTILIVLLAVVIVVTILFIRKKLKKRNRRENERRTQNQGPSQNSTSGPTPAGGTGASPRWETQHQDGQVGNQPERPAETTQRIQSPGNNGRTESPGSSQDRPSTSVGTMTENTERVPPAQSGQDIIDHNETNEEYGAEIQSPGNNGRTESPGSSQDRRSTSAGTMTENTERVPPAQSGQDIIDHNETNEEYGAEATEPLLSECRSDSTETTNKPPKVDNPSIVYNKYSTHAYTLYVSMPDRKGETKLQSPQDPGISEHIDSSITGLEMEANSSPTDAVNEETPKKTTGPFH